jgi:NADH:ubiquinone reductase (H+-translocating)
MAEKIYILGGGFGGIYSAMELEHRLAADRDIEITLVNRDNFFLFTPSCILRDRSSRMRE